jgi:DNA-binding MurR/RpiR family transcriptional regulator
MKARWMTMAQIAAEMHVSVAEARRLVHEMDCPKAFKARGELVLIALPESEA